MPRGEMGDSRVGIPKGTKWLDPKLPLPVEIHFEQSSVHAEDSFVEQEILLGPSGARDDAHGLRIIV